MTNDKSSADEGAKKQRQQSNGSDNNGCCLLMIEGWLLKLTWVDLYCNEFGNRFLKQSSIKNVDAKQINIDVCDDQSRIDWR